MTDKQIRPSLGDGAAIAAASLAQAEKPPINLADILAMAFRQRKIIIPLTLAGPIIASAVTVMTPPTYQASVTVKIDNERVKIFAGQDLDPAISITETARYLATQTKLIQSKALAAKVADSLALERNDRLRQVIPAGLKGIKDGQRSGPIIDYLLNNVKMTATGESRIGTITFTSRDPKLARLIADGYAEQFVGLNVQQRYDTNAYARKILTEQIEQSRKALVAAERGAIDFIRANKLINIGGNANGGGSQQTSEQGSDSRSNQISTANLVQVNDAYIQARTNRIATQQRLNAAIRANVLDIPDARSNSALQSLVAERALISAKLAELRTRYLPGRPEVREMQSQLQALDREIDRQGQSIRNSIRAEFDAVRAQEEQLRQVREELADQSLAEQEKRVQLNMMTRDADTLRKQLDDLLTRLNEISAAADVATNNIAIIDKAEEPNDPISPVPLRNLLIGLLLGLGGAFIAAAMREILDEKLRRPEDVEEKLRVPLLGVIPLGEGDVHITLTDQKSTIAESYYSLRTSVDYASGGDIPKVLHITSGAKGEGKSTTAYALAIDFARTNRKVLLVDLDARVPSLHRLFDLPNKTIGITECLMEGTPVDEAMIATSTEGLTILPLGKRPTNPVQLLSSEQVDRLFESLRCQFDVIIIDGPPVLGLADAPLISRLADGVLFVAEGGKAHNGQVKSAIRRLKDNGAKVLGAIMTKFDATQAGYTYGYRPYYYYNYAYRYAEDPGEELA